MTNLNEFHLYGAIVRKGKRYIPLFTACTAVSAVSNFMLFSSVGVLLSNVVAVATQQSASQAFDQMKLYIIIVLLISLLSSLAGPGFSYIEGNLQQQLQREMTDSYIRANERRTEEISGTELVNRINHDLPEILKLVGSHISGWIFQPFISGMLSIVMLMYIDWTVAVLCGGAVMVFLEDCVAIVLLLVLGTALAEHGYIQFASIMLALPLVDQIGQAFVAIVNFPVLVKEVSPNAERIFEIISLPKAEDEWRQEKSEESSQWDDQGRGDGPGAIGFDNVSFCYGRRKILQGVSFVIPRGQKVALVGESGGGKSTIIKLILGLYSRKKVPYG